MRIHSAAEKNDVKKLEELLAGGTPVDQRDSTGDTALLAAARAGKEKAFLFLLERGADPMAVGHAKETVLHRAASAGNEAMVKALLERGADPNQLCSYAEMMAIQPGLTPFHAALFNDHFALAELLLAHGADVNAKLEDGRTGLELVVDLEDRKLAKWLKAHGATPIAAKEAMKGKTTDLHKAAKAGKLDQLRKCLQSGHAVDERDPEGWTALMHAAENGHLELFQELLAAKPDVNACNLQGRMVFHCIMKTGQPEMAKAWIAAGGDINHKANVSLLTPLMLSAMKKNVEIARLLLEAGADANAMDAQGNTAAKWAKQFGNAKLTKLLQEHTTFSDDTDSEAPAELPGTEVPYREVKALVRGFPEAAAQPPFQELLRKLTEWCGVAPEPKSEDSAIYRLRLKKKNLTSLATRFQLEPPSFEEGAEEEDQPLLEALIDKLQTEVHQAGFLLVQADLVGIGASVNLRLFPTRDPYAVIAATGTNGNRMIEVQGEEDFLTAKHIVAWLRRMAVENPFVLTQCGKDLVGGIFPEPIRNVKQLARRMYEFCPDIVDQGTDTVENLAREMEADQSFFLWWD